MSNFIQPCHCLLCPLLPRVLQTVILQCTVEFYVIQSLCPTNTEQNCGHTQSRKHYEASMKIVHVRHENCGYL